MTAPNPSPTGRVPGPATLAAGAAALLVIAFPQAGAALATEMATELATGASTSALLAGEALAQGAPARRMRDFWHVFAAYAIAWLLLGGWVVAIVRRLGKVEARLERLPGGDEGRDPGRAAGPSSTGPSSPGAGSTSEPGGEPR